MEVSEWLRGSVYDNLLFSSQETISFLLCDCITYLIIRYPFKKNWVFGCLNAYKYKSDIVITIKIVYLIEYLFSMKCVINSFKWSTVEDKPLHAKEVLTLVLYHAGKHASIFVLRFLYLCSDVVLCSSFHVYIMAT